MNITEFYDKLTAWSLNNPYYYTDGQRFYANHSHRKAYQMLVRVDCTFRLTKGWRIRQNEQKQIHNDCAEAKNLTAR